jgi:hypothetical protein
MLSKGDDYPIHQTPDPIAFSGTDRNFYDRYFFNGYSTDGRIHFALALGVYPHLNIMDAAFAVRINDRQYNLRASRHLGMERMDIQVGPIRIEVTEPLRRLRLVVEDNAHGISADLCFEGRSPPLEEPRSTRRHGPRVLMDFTRMTQFGRYSGWIQAGDHRIEFERGDVVGVRDRSWGVRAIGAHDPQAMVPAQDRQFHWFWITATLEDRAILFLLNEDANGASWHRGMTVCHDDGRIEPVEGATLSITYQRGTRWPQSAVIRAKTDRGGDYVVAIEPGPRFYMTGIGYMDPDWSHGMNKGPLAIGYDEIDAAKLQYQPPYIYVEAFSRTTVTLPDGRQVLGNGMLESLSIGPHAVHGFRDAFDGA